MREKILINRNWRFLSDPDENAEVKTKAGMYLSAKTERLKWGPGSYSHNDVPDFWSQSEELPTERWQSVDLPHDYIIGQTPSREESGALGFFTYHPAWYRKHFQLRPEDHDRRIAIYFEGITGISDIYLNGCFLRHNEGGYVSFEVDITDLARFDQENVLAVRVNPAAYDGWWYAGGGIYRNVWLVKTDPVAIDLWGIFVPVRKLEEERWLVPVELSVRNIGYREEAVEALCEILSPDREKVGEIRLAGMVPAREVAVLTGSGEINSPQLWDLDTPRQYTLRVTLHKKTGEAFVPCDCCEQRFGFREVVLTADRGLLLNGRSVKLKGVCAHLDFGLTGKAVPDNICRYKVRLYREMGANAFRASHYPHQEATMDACDELGLLVMDETRRFESNPDALAQMEMLVRRDRNRPSVFLWSTGNEEMTYHTIEQGQRIHRALEHVVRKLDPTRPVTSATTNIFEATIPEVCEVIGVNYGMNHYAELREKFPDKPVVSTENCAIGSSRGWYWGDSPERGYVDARDTPPEAGRFQVFDREDTWKFIMSHPWIAGGFQWDAVEHRGEAIWPRLCSVSGAIDLFLQKKDAFYQNQSHWLETPMIHLLPHWTHPGFEGVPVSVWAYTNCEEAELFLDGESLGRRRVEKWGHAEWSVPYRPGRLEAVGYCGGKRCVSDLRESTGPAVALRLQLENGPVFANGEDLALFTCLALDAEGREVPDASALVHFDCSGPGRIIGTGSDNTDHVPVTSPDRRMYAGRISVAVKPVPTQDAGSVVLSLIARAEGLRSAVLRVEFAAAPGADGAAPYSARS